MEITQEALATVRAAAGAMDTNLHPGPLEHMGVFFGALAKAQAAFEPVVTDKTAHVRSEKGNYQFGYASLAEILSKTKAHLCANGLCLTQLVTEADNVTGIRTILGHESGSMMEGTLRIHRADFKNVKDFGAAITYLRRYVVGPMLGVAAEEDIENDESPDDRPGPISADVHAGMRDATSIGALSKIMSGLSKEEKQRYGDYFNQRSAELREAV